MNLVYVYVLWRQRQSSTVGRYPTEPTQFKAEEIIVKTWSWKRSILERH